MFDLPANYALAQEPETARCVVSASARYKLPPEALLGVMFQEGGKDGTVSKNRDGSHDLGIMQINTVHLKKRSPFRNYVTREKLLNDRCTNIHVAAWIIASYFVKSQDIWLAIGRYHAPYNAPLAWKYKTKLNKKLPYARHTLEANQNYQYYVRHFFGSGDQAVAGR